MESEKTISKETVFSGNFLQLERQRIELANGQRAWREIVRHAPAVGILALMKGGILMVRQYRKAVEESLWEIPAGLIDPGEEPLTAAQRELEEETGYAAKDWQKLATTYTSPGCLDESMTLYLAKDLRRMENPKAPDAEENIEVDVWPLEKAAEALQAGEIKDLKTAYAIQTASLEERMGGHGEEATH